MVPTVTALAALRRPQTSSHLLECSPLHRLRNERAGQNDKQLQADHTFRVGSCFKPCSARYTCMAALAAARSLIAKSRPGMGSLVVAQPNFFAALLNPPVLLIACNLACQTS